MLQAILGGMSLLQQREKNEQAKRDRLLAAQTQALSPWTKLQAQAPGAVESPIAAGIGGYASGMAQEQANKMGDINQQKAMAEVEAIQQGRGPWARQK
jgi:hypothetical protein